jgi:hypothetical protein
MGCEIAALSARADDATLLVWCEDDRLIPVLQPQTRHLLFQRRVSKIFKQA